MPAISMFYGIIIKFYFDDHNPPHFHAEYQNEKALFNMDGEVIKGAFPTKQKALVTAWALLHQDELKANWELAKNGEKVFNIEPLR